jgi:hypothetical protein
MAPFLSHRLDEFMHGQGRVFPLHGGVEFADGHGADPIRYLLLKAHNTAGDMPAGRPIIIGSPREQGLLPTVPD